MGRREMAMEEMDLHEAGHEENRQVCDSTTSRCRMQRVSTHSPWLRYPHCRLGGACVVRARCGWSWYGVEVPEVDWGSKAVRARSARRLNRLPLGAQPHPRQSPPARIAYTGRECSQRQAGAAFVFLSTVLSARADSAVCESSFTSHRWSHCPRARLRSLPALSLLQSVGALRTLPFRPPQLWLPFRF